MLALVVAVALSQCTKDTDCKGERVCSAGACAEVRLTPRELSPAAALLDAQRPALNWPISSIIVGHVLFAAGLILSLVAGNEAMLAAGAALGGSVTVGGLVSLVATLWARARVGQMMDEAR